jgi:hypothetical protein
MLVFLTDLESYKALAQAGVLQVNLHYNRVASAALCVVIKNCDIALIQEPWTSKGEIKGLKLIYSRSNQNPRTCMLVKKDFKILPLIHFCSRDLMAVKIKTLCVRGPREIILGSAYLPHYDSEPPPRREMEKLVAGCRMEGSHLVIGCDANAQHTTWGSSNINNRGESLFSFMAINLDIINKRNRPTLFTCNRQEAIDVTIATIYVGNFVKDWHVTEEVSCSDHRYIQFNNTGFDRLVEFYCNPCRADWESFRKDLAHYLHGMEDWISNCTDLETAARQLQDTITLAYNNCPSVARRYNRNVSWWNQDLAERRRKVRRLFNVAKKSGIWIDYKRALTDYNKALSQAKETVLEETL